MDQKLLGSKIYCFNPSTEKESKIRNKTIYHYTSPEGLLAILKTPSIRFTDCQFLNDRSEYNHIHVPLEAAFEQVRDSLYDTGLCDMLQTYINDKYDYSEIIPENPSLGLEGLKMLNMRHYVFCASTDPDSLNMWNYYVKGGAYQGYNIGLSANDIINSLSSISDTNIKVFFGPIIYKDKEKIEILKKVMTTTDKKLHDVLKKASGFEECDLATQEKYGELISYIENFRLFFKDAVFSGEKEYRFVIRIPELQTEILNSDLKIGYAIKQGVVTPYCDVPFNKEGVIKKITLSPMVEDTLAKAGLQRYLKDAGYKSDIQIDKSRIPIRY